MFAGNDQMLQPPISSSGLAYISANSFLAVACSLFALPRSWQVSLALLLPTHRSDTEQDWVWFRTTVDEFVPAPYV